MANLPCLNPNCRSHGQPHPNCRCYLAKGGVVGHFCSKANPHDPACSYYAEGGEVGQSLLGDPNQAVTAALMHSGATLFLPKDFSGSFGSKDTKFPMLDFARKVRQGGKQGASAVERAFKGHSPEPQSHVTSKHVEDLKNYVASGKLQEELQDMVNGFSEPDPLANQLGDHNVMLSAAKSRIVNYLNSVRPHDGSDIDASKPFDTRRPNHDHEQKYERLANLAAKPLSILNEVARGTITPGKVQHFKTMFPEIYDHLSQELVKKTVEAKIEGNKPPYSTRQALALFLGQELESSHSPQVIQAAQAVMAPKPMPGPNQAPNKRKNSTKPLSEASKAYETANQAAQTRQRQ